MHRCLSLLKAGLRYPARFNFLNSIRPDLGPYCLIAYAKAFAALGALVATPNHVHRFFFTHRLVAEGRSQRTVSDADFLKGKWRPERCACCIPIAILTKRLSSKRERRHPEWPLCFGR